MVIPSLQDKGRWMPQLARREPTCRTLDIQFRTICQSLVREHKCRTHYNISTTKQSTTLLYNTLPVQQNTQFYHKQTLTMRFVSIKVVLEKLLPYFKVSTNKVLFEKLKPKFYIFICGMSGDETVVL
uniref:Uncharacterized protein n=1 Tax=Clastoptera arizonana TaxID=38151 RepID=A0A1B6CD12_9HEMI